MLAESVTAADANRNFSELLRKVRDGQTVVVTVHGKPVIKLVKFAGETAVANAAHRTLVDRLAAQPVTNGGRWSRASLYEK
jgi:prevent-host-death family protein